MESGWAQFHEIGPKKIIRSPADLGHVSALLLDQDVLLPLARRLVCAVTATCPAAGPLLALQQFVTGSLVTTLAASSVRDAVEAGIAKPHHRPRRQQLDQELRGPTAKARHSIVWKCRPIRRIHRHHAHRRCGCIRDPTAIDRNPEAVREVAEHRRFTTRSDHPVRWRVRLEAVRDEVFASTRTPYPVLSPKHHRRSTSEVYDGRDRGSSVKRAPGRAAARTMADHGHHRRRDGLEAYRAAGTFDRCHCPTAMSIAANLRDLRVASSQSRTKRELA